MSRIITMTGLVGTEPEAKHGKSVDYVKFRFGTKEFGETETWWFNVLCYGKNAKLALDKIKVGDKLFTTGRLLPPLGNGGSKSNDQTVAMLDFNWITSNEQRPQEQATSSFEFDSFDDIPDEP
mgnify:CR=1 FL=1